MLLLISLLYSMRPVAVPLQLTNSPMAIATAPGVNSPNSVAAVLSTLQQLQQAGNNSSLLPSSSPLKTSQILNSPSTTVSGTVTAQPLNFAPFPSKKTPLLGLGQIFRNNLENNRFQITNENNGRCFRRCNLKCLILINFLYYLSSYLLFLD